MRLRSGQKNIRIQEDIKKAVLLLRYHTITPTVTSAVYNTYADIA